MKHQAMLEQMLSFSMQQHQLKDQQIEDLTKQVTDLQKQLDTLKAGQQEVNKVN